MLHHTQHFYIWKQDQTDIGIRKTRNRSNNRTLHFQSEASRGTLSDFPECKYVDIATQFWLARTDKIRMTGGWDNYIKALDHEDFYFNLIFAHNNSFGAPPKQVLSVTQILRKKVQSPVSVVACDSIKMYHYRNSPYRAKWVNTRGRALLEYSKLLTKYGIDAIVDIVKQTITKEVVLVIMIRK
jgi:hypothetical protein